MEEIRHLAAISGYVTDELSGQTISRAVVEIVGQNWQTLTRQDGFFYFMDLPSGEYDLEVSAPSRGSRYGVRRIDKVSVEYDFNGRPIFDPERSNVKLPPTRLLGEVRREGEESLPIENAIIKLLGSDMRTLTDNQGKYVLSGLVQGSPTVEASAQGFETSRQSVSLVAGEKTTADFSLAQVTE